MVEYSDQHWTILNNRRDEAKSILRALDHLPGTSPLVYGSVARGDVHDESDVDVFIPKPLPPYQVQLALTRNNFLIHERLLVMATPWHLPKLHLDLGRECIVTVPMIKPRRIEREFYDFGGSVDLNDLREDRRVPGVNKELELIIPTEKGHRSEGIEGQVGRVAKKLNIRSEMVEERINVLNRRKEVGRTGVHLKRELAPNENAEAVLDKLIDDNPKIRQRLGD